MRAITERAAIKRINRQLAKKDEALRVNSIERFHSTYGRFYIVNTYWNRLEQGHVGLDWLARDLGCLSPEEFIQETA